MNKTVRNTLLTLLFALTAPAYAQTQSPRLAYVDLERLNDNYGLKVELDEQFQALYKKTQDELAAKQKAMETQYNALGRQIETKTNAIAAKMKKTPATGGYKTEAEYNRDQQALAKLQQDAQTKMTKLQSDYSELEQKRTEELSTRQAAFTQTITDSVSHYVAEYNKEKQYDFILIKAATLFANPAYDITEEVLTGLNKQYQDSKNPAPEATQPEAPAATKEE